MKTTLTLAATLLAAMAVAVTSAQPAYAQGDDVPSFKRRSDKDKDFKAFVEQVGTAVLKSARSGPKSIEMDNYKFEDVKGKEHRKDLKIVMNWKGGITKKAFVSTIVLHVDVAKEKEWEVLNVDYSDDNKISPFKPNAAKMQELIKRFNGETK